LIEYFINKGDFMEIIELLLNEFKNNGVSNIFENINLVIDKNFLNENCYKIINDKKVINFWIIKTNGFNEKYFSIKNNVIEEEVIIKGYFGLNNSSNSLQQFKREIDLLCHLLKLINKGSNYLRRNSLVRCSDIKEKYFANILCHYTEITTKYLNIINKWN